jgi:hypothetical protein
MMSWGYALEDTTRHRTQILLEVWQYEALLDLSHRTRESLSAIIRDMINDRLAGKPAGDRKDPLYGIVGLGTGDGASVAREHDDYLYGKRS